MATQSFFDIGNVILEPSSTFTRLKAKTSPMIPLAVMILLSLAILYWWVSTVNFSWLVEHMLAAQPSVKPEAQAAMARFMTPKTMMWSAGIGAVVGTLALCALMALYYLVAGKLMGTGSASIGYGSWFGFSVWASVPRMLTVPLSALQIATSGGRLAPEDLNMVSLNYLLLHLPLSNPWAGLAGSIDLTTLWCIGLAAIGLKAWTGRSTAACVTVAALPYALVYGLWAAKIAILG